MYFYSWYDSNISIFSTCSNYIIFAYSSPRCYYSCIWLRVFTSFTTNIYFLSLLLIFNDPFPFMSMSCGQSNNMIFFFNCILNHDQYSTHHFILTTWNVLRWFPPSSIVVISSENGCFLSWDMLLISGIVIVLSSKYYETVLSYLTSSLLSHY